MGEIICSKSQETGVTNIPNPAITIASIDCACHCEVVSTVAISSEKARLLRFTRNDNSYRWIWVICSLVKKYSVSHYVILACPESFITPSFPLNLRGMKRGYPDKRE